MKAQRVTLKFPPVPTSEWRLLVITDAGWCVRESGKSQGGYLLCLCESKVLQRQEGVCWLIKWASKKLRRVVRSSTAAETLAAQNGLDCVEFAQAFLQECLHGMNPKEFRMWVPEVPSGLVLDSIADCLTKLKGNKGPLFEMMSACRYKITPSKQSGRGKSELPSSPARSDLPVRALRGMCVHTFVGFCSILFPCNMWACSHHRFRVC